jgi:hypothetical protein
MPLIADLRNKQCVKRFRLSPRNGLQLAIQQIQILQHSLATRRYPSTEFGCLPGGLTITIRTLNTEKVREEQRTPTRSGVQKLPRHVLSCENDFDRMQATSNVPQNSSFKVDDLDVRMLPHPSTPVNRPGQLNLRYRTRLTEYLVPPVGLTGVRERDSTLDPGDSVLTRFNDRLTR